MRAILHTSIQVPRCVIGVQVTSQRSDALQQSFAAVTVLEAVTRFTDNSEVPAAEAALQAFANACAPVVELGRTF